MSRKDSLEEICHRAHGLKILGRVAAGRVAEEQEGAGQHLDPVATQDMLSADDFRRIALGIKDAIESAHMGHPDFRVKGRIFATLHADHKWGMVKLTPEQHEAFVRANPAAFVPENGAWGRQGCTAVRLDSVDEDTIGEALTLAWRNSAVRRIPHRPKANPTTRRTPRKK